MVVGFVSGTGEGLVETFGRSTAGNDSEVWAPRLDGETNFGLTSLAAPNAASSSLAKTRCMLASPWSRRTSTPESAKGGRPTLLARADEVIE
jgi:hypothetical protein